MKKKKLFLNIVLVTMIAFTSMKIAGRNIELSHARAINAELKANSKSEALKSQNEDYRFWLTIEGTQVDNPVVQSDDNEFYLENDFNKNDSIAGTLFMDYRNDYLNDRNTIIYGHHMKDGSMFGELKKFRDEDFFNANNKITINNDEDINTYEVFSVYVTDNSTDYLKVSFNDELYSEYLQEAVNKSMYKSNIDVNTDDKIITFSTCSYDFKDARLVVHAKLVD
ncbi:MAG: class B sortase [Clostridium sp.]|nr:class B sortase [Clostridium sp.]MBQ9000182.1 class B sortase [Clostridium sp.]